MWTCRWVMLGIELAQAMEAIANNTADLQLPVSSGVSTVHKLQCEHPRQHNNKPRSTEVDQPPCYRCGYQHNPSILITR